MTKNTQTTSQKMKELLKHDGYFKHSVSIPEVANDFLSHYLPRDLRINTNLDSIKQQPTEFISKKLKKNICDVLFSANVNDETGYFYILAEAQSSLNSWMSLRLLEYMVLICNNHRKKYPNDKQLPFIYPIVFSNADDISEPRQLIDLFNNPVLAKRYLLGPYDYVNFNNISDKSLKEHSISGLFEMALKYKRKISFEELANIVAAIINNLYNISNDESYEDHIDDYVVAFVRYSIGDNEEINIRRLGEILESKLRDDKGEKLMQRIYQEPYEEGKFAGFDLGKAEGFITTAKNMLAQGINANLIAQSTGLFIAEIEKIKSKISTKN